MHGRRWRSATAAAGKLELWTDSQSSHRSTWRLTQSPPELVTEFSRLCTRCLDRQASSWVENGLGLGWSFTLGYEMGFWFVLGLK